MSSRNWWDGLNDVWSEEQAAYLVSGKGINLRDPDYHMGDLIFHRFFGTDDHDVKNVKVVLVELKRWTQWEAWLKTHKASNSMIPIYAHPLEQIIISRRAFRIVRWIDEYRPFDLYLDPLT
jgi:hypothetical protein